MNWLLFTLAAPLASFGLPGPVEKRGSSPLPTRSALLGLLAAALGLRRDDAAGLDDLAQRVRFACRVERSGSLLRDYHTIQTPPQPLLKKAPHRTRRDELSFPRDQLNTVLSRRDYHEDYRATIGVHCPGTATQQELQQALLRPKFTLYVGRKTCVLAWPLDPQPVDAENWEAALAQFDRHRGETEQRWRDAVRRRGLWWPLTPAAISQQAIESALAAHVVDPTQWRETRRRDIPHDRQQWLFAPNSWLERTQKETAA